jgi:hypothetical protein
MTITWNGFFRRISFRPHDIAMAGAVITRGLYIHDFLLSCNTSLFTSIIARRGRRENDIKKRMDLTILFFLIDIENYFVTNVSASNSFTVAA